MLTRSELAAIRAVLEVRHGWSDPLTQRVHEEWAAAEPEPTNTHDFTTEVFGEYEGSR